MPPQEYTDETSKTATEAEMCFFKAMMGNLNSKPDVDWDNVASAVGLKNSKCARERYRQISLKFGWKISKASKAAGLGSRDSYKSTGALAATPTKVGKHTGTGRVGAKKNFTDSKMLGGMDAGFKMKDFKETKDEMMDDDGEV